MELRRHRTEITIETLSVTTIKRREPVQPLTICSNCGHGVTTFDPKQTESVTDDNPIIILAAKAKTGEVL